MESDIRLLVHGRRQVKWLLRTRYRAEARLLGKLAARRYPHSQPQHTNFEVRVFLGSKKRKLVEHWSIQLDIDGRYQEVIKVEPTEKPEQSPRLHLGKPLHIVLPALSFTAGEETDIRAVVTSRTPGSTATAMTFAKGFPADVHPVAEITFPGKTPDAKPIVLKVPLTQRC